MPEDPNVSKTQRKKQMHDLQAIGAALVRLSPDRLQRIDIPEALREAVLDAQRFNKHEARRRQLQYIGRIMRDLDPAPIADQLSALEAPSRKQTAVFHVAEKWRQSMIDDPSNVDAFVKEFPEADAARLRELAIAGSGEKRGDKPPRQFRELFHVINAVLQERSRKPV